jgi:hypothetical protein
MRLVLVEVLHTQHLAVNTKLAAGTVQLLEDRIVGDYPDR